MREISYLEFATEQAAKAMMAAGCTLQELAATFQQAAPALREVAAVWGRIVVERERTLRERLGICRYLSSEWWALRKYQKESGDAGG